MPVLVVGADTPVGEAIVEALLRREGEVRAFVSDASFGESLRERRVKVAVGDLSDDSHIEGAGMQAFCAVLVTGSVRDGRELAFASSPELVYVGWTSALRACGIRRAIWVLDAELGDPDPAWAEATPEHAFLHEKGRSRADIAREVARLDDAARI
jgi:nucleoside-diphosphate-sugar epimerase